MEIVRKAGRKSLILGGVLAVVAIEGAFLFGGASSQSLGRSQPVVCSTWDLRCAERIASVASVVMRVEPAAVRPGGSVRIRLENRGAEGASYGLPFTLERRDNRRWIRLPSQGPFFLPLLGLPPGKVGEWQRVEIDGSDPPGRYRVQKRVWLGGHRKAVIRSTFRVARPAA